MAKQSLGKKKMAQIQRILGETPVLAAYVNGYGRPHYWAETWCEGRELPIMVNWKTGDVEPWGEVQASWIERTLLRHVRRLRERWRERERPPTPRAGQTGEQALVEYYAWRDRARP